MTKFVSLLSDTTFKYLFQNPKPREWLENIIKGKCGIDLSNYELIDKELVGGGDTKTTVLDNLLKDNSNNYYVIVEMQRCEDDMKNYTYLYRVAGNRIKKAEEYQGKVTLIQFKGSIPKNCNDEVLLHFRLREDNNPDMLRPGIESYEIILPNISKISYNKLNEIDKKLSLFKCKNYEDMKKYASDSKDLEIIEELERLSMDENFMFTYDQEAALEMSKYEAEQRGLKQGIEKGIEQKTKEAAINLYKNDVSKEVIMKSLNIDEETLNKYLEED